MNDSDFSNCRVCQSIKVRIVSGKFPNGTKKHVDHMGKLWNGRVCPDCTQERVRNAMRENRKSKGTISSTPPVASNQSNQ